MRIYDFPFAPNPRKLRVYLAEKGIELPREMVNLVNGEHRKPEFLAKNPLGALPVLELDDGSILTESLAIIEFLEELHPDPPMIGTEPLERARVRELERAIDASLLGRVARIFHNTRSPLPNARVIPEVADRARETLPEVLAVIDARVGDGPFAAGERPSIADCTLFAAFKLAEMGEFPLEGGPNLKRWYEFFSARPSAQA